MKLTALLRHLTVDLLRESFYSLKRKAAPGVDGVTWQGYEAGREDRLVDLHSRVHRGAYRAMPSRRVYIEKEDGRKRHLGVAALKDKIVQQVVVAILNQIYEEDFLGFSYGLKVWLEAPAEETDEKGNKHRSTRNRDEGRGTLQGAPISPLHPARPSTHETVE